MAELTVVIPAYNEEGRIEVSLRSAARFAGESKAVSEVIVVDDGSRDATPKIIEKLQQEYACIRLIRHEQNRGKGMAVRTGVLAAKTEFALFSDVDEAVPIGEALKLLEAAVAESADVAIGTRYHPDSLITKRQPWPRIAVSRVGNVLVRALALPGLRDTQCGFKLFRTATMRGVMERVSIAGFGFDLEVLAIARAWGRRIIEVPVTWAHGEGSTLRLGRAAWTVFKDLVRITWRLRTGGYGRGEDRETGDRRQETE